MEKKKENLKKQMKESKNKKTKSRSSSKGLSRSRSRSRSRSNSKENNKTEQKISSKNNKNFPEGKEIKIIHWNVNGLRPLLKTDELDKLIKEEDPDFICINETKIDNDLIKSMNLHKLCEEKYKYKSYWYCPTEKKGYAGTAILTKYEPISVAYGMNIKKHDNEGRMITLEYDKFSLVSCYTPNAGEGLKRVEYRVKEWDKDFFEYINNLKNKNDVIFTGDLNVAREDIDIFDPKGKEKLAGFSKMEKESFNNFLKQGYIDTFRDLHPKEQKYSFFSKRAKGKESNKGWRLDYFIINKDAKNLIVKESNMLDKDKYNASDHIPITFTFNLK